LPKRFTSSRTVFLGCWPPAENSFASRKSPSQEPKKKKEGKGGSKNFDRGRHPLGLVFSKDGQLPSFKKMTSRPGKKGGRIWEGSGQDEVPEVDRPLNPSTASNWPSRGRLPEERDERGEHAREKEENHEEREGRGKGNGRTIQKSVNLRMQVSTALLRVT